MATEYQVTGDTSGVSKDILQFLKQVAQHFGRNIPISSGRRSASYTARILLMQKAWCNVRMKSGECGNYSRNIMSYDQWKTLDTAYSKYYDKTAKDKERREAKDRFLKIAEQTAGAKSLHKAGRAVDIRRSELTDNIRIALKTKLTELQEDACWHYQASSTISVATESEKATWPRKA